MADQRGSDGISIANKSTTAVSIDKEESKTSQAPPGDSEVGTGASNQGEGPPKGPHTIPIPDMPLPPPGPGLQTGPMGTFKMPLFGPRLGFKKKSASVTKAFGSSDTDKKTDNLDKSSGVQSKGDDSPKQSINSTPTGESGPSPSGSDEVKTKSSSDQVQSTEQITVPYKEPNWGGIPESKYDFEILKNGVIIETMDMSKKSFYVFGRLQSCDSFMEHPSLSRYHAVLQYCAAASEGRERGWYLYDLDSTHGTWINKNKVKPNVYCRVRVGHVVKFGGSSRLCILQGPNEDQDEESELTVTELREQRLKLQREADLLKQAELQEMEEEQRKQEQAEQEAGCTWGIADDLPDPETDPLGVSEAVPLNEELYIEDPKKALKGYFEREGYELPEYDFTEIGRGKFKCQVELPLDSPTGEPINAEVTVSGKKRDAVIACALEACRILDRHGVLRKSHHESRKRKKKNWEDEDFYDSDEDLFLDRTGTIEKKRQLRMKRSGKAREKAETYESIMAKIEGIAQEIKEIEHTLEKAKQEAEKAESEEMDALDAFMSTIKSGTMDSKTRMKLKRQLFDLRQEEQKLQRLASIAKPATLPDLKRPAVPIGKSDDTKGKTSQASLPMFGKIKGTSKPIRSVPVGPTKPKPVETSTKEMEEEEEEEEEDEEEAMETDSKLKSSAQSKSLQKDSKPSEPQGEQKEKPSDHTPKPLDKDNLKKGIYSFIASYQHNKGEKPSKPTPDSIPEKQKKTKPPETSKEYDTEDPDYAVWMPPTGQSGDGRTHLNDKYGY